MASSNTNRKMMSIGLFAAPLALVMGAKLYLGSSAGPTSALATPVEQATVDKKRKPIVAPTYTARQKAAAEYIRSISNQTLAPGACPFLYEPRAVQPQNPSNAEPIVPLPFNPGTPSFSAQAILKSSSGSTALIDGKPVKEGQKLRGTDWEVTTIDAESRSITLRETTSGRTITIQVETPKIGSGE